MWRLAFVVGLIVLGVVPTALTQSSATSFAFTTFDAPFTGAINTQNGGINNLGVSVGVYCLDAFGNMCHVYRRSANGVFTRIDPPDAIDNFNFTNDININGVIVSPYRNAPGRTGVHCFMLNFATGVYTTLDVPATMPGPFFGGYGTRCRGINDLGQIVGSYRVLIDSVLNVQVNHGFMLSNGNWTPIDFPGAAHTFGVRINNLGQIVGGYTLQDGLSHAFLFDGTTYINIDVPGAKETAARGINNKGQIVGTYRDANDFLFGFIRTTNSSQSLPGGPPLPAVYTQVVLPGPGQKLGIGQNMSDPDFTSDVAAINDRGQISGDFFGIDSHVHGFVTAPKSDFEVTASAVVQSLSGPIGIAGVFEGDPVGEGTFTLDTTSPLVGIPQWGLFVFCGRFQPPQPPLVLTTNTGDQIFIDLLLTVCQTAFSPVPFRGVISGFYRITGGTGQFGGTSGSGFITGTLEAPAPPTPGTVTFTLEGTITR